MEYRMWYENMEEWKQRSACWITAIGYGREGDGRKIKEKEQ